MNGDIYRWYILCSCVTSVRGEEPFHYGICRRCEDTGNQPVPLIEFYRESEL